MSMFQAPPDTHTKSRYLVWVGVTCFAGLLILAYFSFRYYPEKKTAEQFFESIAAGDMARAYKLWKPKPSYTTQDFLDDWGPKGYYGPVLSYRITGATSPRGASGVIVTVQVSPYSPFPTKEEPEKSRRTRTVGVWIETKDKSISFPP